MAFLFFSSHLVLFIKQGLEVGSTGKAGYCWLCCIHLLCIVRHNREEKNHLAFTHSRLKEPTSEFPGGLTTAEWATLGSSTVRPKPNDFPEKSESLVHYGESEKESVGFSSRTQSSSQKGNGHLGGVANM